VSYSRWGNSEWYTLWLAQGEEETRDTATFVVMGTASFTARELREDLDGCMEKARLRSRGVGDIDELRGYAEQFLRDVDARHGRGMT
jgi:hypothetical protein